MQCFFLAQFLSPICWFINALFPYIYRIIFSAHAHEFCDYTHSDGTREVTVSAMTWKARDDPGFVIANFHGNGRGVSVSYCSLARESQLLIAYGFVLISLSSIMLVANITQLRRSRWWFWNTSKVITCCALLFVKKFALSLMKLHFSFFPLWERILVCLCVGGWFFLSFNYIYISIL